MGGMIMMRKVLLIILVVWGISSTAQKTVYSPRPEDTYPTGLFKSDNAYTFDVMNNTNASSYYNVFQFLQGRVPGLYVYDGGVFNRPYVTYRSGRPAFFLNEMQVSAGTLASISMSDIAFIKVFRPPFFGAFGGGPNGAIAVYTQRGEGDEEEE